MTRALAALAILLALAGPAGAVDFDQAVARARAGMKAGDSAKTLGGLREAIRAAWEKLPFSAINVHLVAAQPGGYGRYLPRVDNVYRLGEPMILYMEPVGFKVRLDQKRGIYTRMMAADFNLVDAWGRVISGRRDFGRFGGESRHFPDQMPLTFTYNLSGLPPGEYRVETILRDILGKKSTTVAIPVVIKGP